MRMRYGKLENYIDSLIAKGRYYFTSNEVTEALSLSQYSFRNHILPLQQQAKVVLIRQGFYAIVTPEYRSIGSPPVTHYLDGLMMYLGRPYYVSLLNAAAWYGAAHQQPQKYFVMINPPTLLPVEKSHVRIDFVYKKEWNKDDIVPQKTNAGYVNVSSPELTALDLCYYPKHSGGVNQVATVLDELAEALDSDKVLDVSKRFNSTMAVQRLGFLLDFLGNEELTLPLKNWLATQKFYPTVLDPAEQSHNKVTGNFWKIIVNTDIETDL